MKRRELLEQYAACATKADLMCGQVEYPELAVLRDEKKKSLTM